MCYELGLHTQYVQMDSFIEINCNEMTLKSIPWSSSTVVAIIIDQLSDDCLETLLINRRRKKVQSNENVIKFLNFLKNIPSLNAQRDGER